MSKDRDIKIPPTTLSRLRSLSAQRAQIEAQQKLILETLLDMLGLKGNFSLDLDTGVVKPAAPVPPVNGHDAAAADVVHEAARAD